MSSCSRTTPVTEIFYLSVDPEKDLNDQNCPSGQRLVQILELCKSSPGFQRLYWGRALEYPEKVRLHVVRDTLVQHREFLRSESGVKFQSSLQELQQAETKLVVRHVLLEENVPQNGVAHEAPLTGSALYLNSNDVYANYAWPLWTHIVRHAPGNLGVAGGRVLDHKSGHEAYLVYVGWETNDHHQAFRKSPACADRRVILTLGNDGMDEYHHVVFEKGA